MNELKKIILSIIILSLAFTTVLQWDVSGSYNNKSGIWELVIDYKTNTIVHFLFRGK